MARLERSSSSRRPRRPGTAATVDGAVERRRIVGTAAGLSPNDRALLAGEQVRQRVGVRSRVGRLNSGSASREGQARRSWSSNALEPLFRFSSGFTSVGGPWFFARQTVQQERVHIETDAENEEAHVGRGRVSHGAGDAVGVGDTIGRLSVSEEDQVSRAVWLHLAQCSEERLVDVRASLGSQPVHVARARAGRLSAAGYRRSSRPRN